MGENPSKRETLNAGEQQAGMALRVDIRADLPRLPRGSQKPGEKLQEKADQRLHARSKRRIACLQLFGEQQPRDTRLALDKSEMEADNRA